MPTVPPNPPSVPPGPIATEGVAAMIPVANITLEDALLDNPNFRANIKLFEGQVFFIESWLVALQRSMNMFTEEWERLNEVTSVLNKRAEVPLLSQGMLSSQYTIPAMKLTGEAFRTTLALKNKYISEVNEKVLKPLEDFLKTDLKDFKESKKVFDKALEKYESTLAKYNGQSRQKEPSALREEAFQLYDTRKAYIQAAMACSMLCIKFQDGLDQLVLGVFLDLIATQHDYFSGNADHFGSMALQVLQLKTYMKGHKEASATMLQELEQDKERYTADAIEYWKPSRSLKCYSNMAPTSKSTSTIGHAALGPAFAAQMAGQVPMSTLLNRPATISHSSTVGTNRLPLPMQQFQSQSSNMLVSPSSPGLPKSNSSQTTFLESLPGVDTLSINTSTPSRNNNISSLTLLPNAGSTLTLSNPGSPSSANFNQTTFGDISAPTTKQGYLNIRIPQPKNRAPVWQRKYFFIQEAEFGFESVVSNPTVGSQVVQSERIAVLLCEVRYGSSSNSLITLSGGGNPASGSQGLSMVHMERRFCFEVVCATQSYLLQAETEDDLMSWVNTFEAAKRDVLMQQQLPRHMEPEEPYSPIPDSANPSFSFSGEDLLEAQTVARAKASEEAEDPKPTGSLGLGWAASVPGVSLLLNSYAGNNAVNNNNSGNKTESATTVLESGDKITELEDSSQTKNGGTEVQTSDSPSSLQLMPRLPAPDTDVTTHARSRSVGDATSGHSHQISEIERLMTSSLHLVPKATPLAVSEIPHYPMELVVRNRELHLRFHGTKVHSKEYVLHSWTSGYRDDSRPDNTIMIYGRIFLTQSGMYFYARDMSVEMKRMYRFSTIRGIECEQKDIATEWRIETMDGVQHVFHQFTLTDTEYQVLHLIWTNVHQAKDRLPVKELFRRTMLITSKPKGSAGSGSLAATESTHLTTRDGTMTRVPAGYSGDGTGSFEGVGSEAASMRGNDEEWEDLEDDLPADMEAPSGPVTCNCPGHLEKNELEQTFDISAKTMNRLLFGENSPVWKEFHERRNNSVQSVSGWEKKGDKKTRTVKFLMVVNNPLVKLNQTDCVESQTCEVEEDYLRYSYTVKSSVLAMPYSDAFTPVLRYCITYVSKDSCKLTCSSGIEWHKNPMVKAMIKGAILKGTAETVKDLTEIVQLHLEHRKGQAGRGAGAGGPGMGTRSAPASDRNGGIGGHGRHAQSDSSKIMISLHGPDDDAHSVLLDPHDDNNSDFVVDNSKDSRVPGARRHTVSAAAGAGGLMYSGPRVQGQWPTGSQPSFVPIGSKASRTKLLGRPSKSALIDQEAPSRSEDTNIKAGSPQHGVHWLKQNVMGFIHSKNEKERRSISTKLLFVVLLVSSLINIWAAYNSQRMLTSTWRLKEHGFLGAGAGAGGPLRGYPEPLHRILGSHRQGQGHRASHGQDDFRNMRVAARAVYLKDLEEQMQSGELEGFDDGRTVDRKCFGIFLEVRESFRSWPQPPLEDWMPDQKNDSGAGTVTTSLSAASSQPTPSPGSTAFFAGVDDDDGVAKYPWLLPHHRRWATRIIFQRDRVGILRHDLLVTFEVLKQLERRLLETEYINWIMDERSRCRLWERRKKAEVTLSKSKVKGVGANVGDETLLSDDEFLRQPENPESSKEDAKERIAHVDQNEHHRSEEDGDIKEDREEDEESKRKQEFKAEVTKEFCQGLEHQFELFMLDTKT